LIQLNIKVKKNQKRKKRKINWSKYNESLVRRGEVMFDIDFSKNWRTELTRERKEQNTFIRIS
jgi:hypothetical protein